MRDITCPYCDHDFDYWHTDPPDDGEELACPECEKNMILDIEHIISFSAREAPCLNGEPHKFKDASKGFFRYEWVKRCEYCDKYEYGPVIPDKD